MKKKLYVFDLDGTTIDSSERVTPCLDSIGDLNLQLYIDTACTHEKIMSDKLLPLATYMQQLIKAGETVIIMTARHCNSSDYYFLRKNNLVPKIVLSRDQLQRIFGHDNYYRLGDAEYKRNYFEYLFTQFKDADIQFFDDHDGILAMAQELPITAIDAKIMNQVLVQQLTDMYEQGCTDSETLYEDLISECSANDLIIV